MQVMAEGKGEDVPSLATLTLQLDNPFSAPDDAENLASPLKYLLEVEIKQDGAVDQAVEKTVIRILIID